MLLRIVAGCLLPLLLVSSAFSVGDDGGAPGVDGRWWLAQPAATRQNFIRGWTDGYATAWLSAQARLIAVVEEARAAIPPERKLAAALLVSLTVLQDANPEYRRPTAYYADQVTTFFTSYADLRECPVGLVLKGLDGRSRLSLDAIAQWLRETWAR